MKKKRQQGRTHRRPRREVSEDEDEGTLVASTGDGVSLQLSKVLFEASHCSSLEEAQSITEAILEESLPDSDRITTTASNIIVSADFRERCGCALEEYFGMPPLQASELVQRAFFSFVLEKDHQEEDDWSSSTSTEQSKSNEEVEEEENKAQLEETQERLDIIGEGECELCERYIKLTRHHLIPRSTHARMKRKLICAVEALQKGDSQKANTVLGDGLQHFVPVLVLDFNTDHPNTKNSRKSKSKSSSPSPSSSAATSRRFLLMRTCSICRPCHSTIHKTHDNLTLAEEYNTVEKLLTDPTIRKFCKWASKQKAGKYSVP